MGKIVFGLWAMMMLAACATEEAYRAALQSWIGAREQQLVSHWGPPEGFYEAEGVRFLTYQKSSSHYSPGTPPRYETTMIGNQAYTRAIGGSDGYVVNLNCKTSFEVRNSVITSYRFEGNNCVAYPPK